MLVVLSTTKKRVDITRRETSLVFAWTGVRHKITAYSKLHEKKK